MHLILDYRMHIFLEFGESSVKMENQTSETDMWSVGCFGLLTGLLELQIVISTYSKNLWWGTGALPVKFCMAQRSKITFHTELLQWDTSLFVDFFTLKRNKNKTNTTTDMRYKGKRCAMWHIQRCLDTRTYCMVLFIQVFEKVQNW